MPDLPPQWQLTATSFNWTPELLRADRSATELALGVIDQGIASTIEIEAGQVWRGFPNAGDAEIDALRDAVAARGGRVSMVGASIDEWRSPTRRRSDDERFDFIEPQLRASARLGADGIRLPLGQAGPALLARLQPLLHDLDLTLYEEIQGSQSPDASPHREAIDTIATIDDPRIRVLVDCSMLMPALPVSYLERLAGSGLPAEVMDAIAERWADPSTHDAVIGLLRSGGVPPQVHTLYMNLLVRFGRQRASDLRGILPLTGALHLKFWDLDDTDGRVSSPLRELAPELLLAGFEGTLCSEWGGHEWLDTDPAALTRGHLELAAAALADGVASAAA